MILKALLSLNEADIMLRSNKPSCETSIEHIFLAKRPHRFEKQVPFCPIPQHQERMRMTMTSLAGTMTELRGHSLMSRSQCFDTRKYSDFCGRED